MSLPRRSLPAERARCRFVPPYLVDRLAVLDADRRLSSSGRLTLRLDDSLRASRDAPARTMRPPRSASGGTRVVHDAGTLEQLPGTVARSDGDPASGDPAVDEAFSSAGQVWDLFADLFNRRSADGNGTPLSVTVHFGLDYDNAFWDGEQLVFGDGDGEVFERFTKPADVLAHEFTHGVTQFTAGLAYQGQPGALNESVSDVFAALTRQRALGQRAPQADWLIGVGIFYPGVRALALRSMIEPGTAYDDPRLGRDRQVGSMTEFVDTEEDSGGVHINSGIPNRAFALTAIALGGPSWEQPGQVWYDAITSGEVGAQTDFTGFAQATVSSAARLHPADPRVAAEVRRAWVEVGVLQLSASGGATTGGATPSGTTPGAATLPADPTPGAATQHVAVRRTGGIAGLTRAAELDLDLAPEGEEVRSLLSGVDFSSAATTSSSADRFLYTLEYGDLQLTVPEQDLTPELHRVVQIVLGAPSTPLDLG